MRVMTERLMNLLDRRDSLNGSIRSFKRRLQTEMDPWKIRSLLAYIRHLEFDREELRAQIKWLDSQAALTRCGGYQIENGEAMTKVRGVKTKRWTSLELVKMSKHDYKCFCILLEARAFRLLGIPWKLWIKIWQDPDGSIVCEWE